jgi:hypothetical protein
MSRLGVEWRRTRKDMVRRRKGEAMALVTRGRHTACERSSRIQLQRSPIFTGLVNWVYLEEPF